MHHTHMQEVVLSLVDTK